MISYMNYNYKDVFHSLYLRSEDDVIIVSAMHYVAQHLYFGHVKSDI